MAKAQQVVITHEGESNPKLMKIGGIILLVGLVLFAIDSTLGALGLIAGGITLYMGMQKTTKPCPNCRVKISPRAGVCPACHQSTGWVSREPEPVEIVR